MSNEYFKLPKQTVFKDLELNKKRRVKVLKIAENIYSDPSRNHTTPEYGGTETRRQADNNEIITLIQNRFKSESTLNSL